MTYDRVLSLVVSCRLLLSLSQTCSHSGIRLHHTHNGLIIGGAPYHFRCPHGRGESSCPTSSVPGGVENEAGGWIKLFSCTPVFAMHYAPQAV